MEINTCGFSPISLFPKSQASGLGIGAWAAGAGAGASLFVRACVRVCVCAGADGVRPGVRVCADVSQGCLRPPKPIFGSRYFPATGWAPQKSTVVQLRWGDPLWIHRESPRRWTKTGPKKAHQNMSAQGACRSQNKCLVSRTKMSHQPGNNCQINCLVGRK